MTRLTVTRWAVAGALAACACGGGGGGGGGPEAPTLRAFMTSVSGPGNLSTWADAGGKTGLEAADAVCQARATAAALTGTFRALLSDSGNDVQCRLAGFAGLTAQRCGHDATWQLPEPGPWVRMDGFPFARRTDDVPYVPIRFDELGAPVRGSAWIKGAYPDESCSDWTTSAAGHAYLVDSMSVVSLAGQPGSDCGEPRHLLCMEVGQGAPLAPPSRAGKKLAFLTSSTGTGDLASWDGAGGKTGLAAGDAVCQARAAAAALPNAERFKAWLSDETTNAIDRLGSNGPWVRVDGVPVASDKTALTSAPLFTAIVLTEAGGTLAEHEAWTGTGGDGTRKVGDTCAGWTADNGAGESELGWIGTISSPEAWTDDVALGCGRNQPLYCFED